MLDRHSARLHAWLTLVLATLGVRLRSHPERGQGTVEYVALILLVAAVLAAAVVTAHRSTFDLADIVTKQLKSAIESVGSKK